MVNPLRILVVEDDEDDADFLQEALQEYGVNFTINVLVQGDQALPYLEQSDLLPDVIILDLNLPRMHGTEILHLIKKSPRFQHIPVVILTTSSAVEERNLCTHAGAHSFLTKPVSMQGFQDITSTIVQAATEPLLG